MRAGVSVMICTYNGARRLPETLAHLARQRVPENVPWEVVLVDNASTDHTASLAQVVWKELGSPTSLRVVQQPIAGLNPAREKGFASARYEYIVVCDDDNWLNPEYVYTAWKIMEAQPQLGILGGHGELAFEEEPPAWLKAYCIYANGPQAERSGRVAADRVYGAGSVVRKSAYQFICRAGFKALLSDRKAAQLTSGGDYEFCYAFALAGYEIWYEDSLRFQHFISKDRIDWTHYMRYIRESAACFEVLLPYKVLLKHRSTHTLAFNYHLVRNFCYHLRLFFPVWWQYKTSAQGSKIHHISFIRYIILLNHLKSFVMGLGAFHRYFARVRSYYRSLQKSRKASSTARLIPPLPVNTEKSRQISGMLPQARVHYSRK